MKFYKIKVGIEEYQINEEDIPRILEAMKKNDMVKLDCGIFRGQAILAICRDVDKENQFALNAPKRKTPEEVEKENNQILLKKQMDECKLCERGWIFVTQNYERIAKRCSCTVLKMSN